MRKKKKAKQTKLRKKLASAGSRKASVCPKLMLACRKQVQTSLRKKQAKRPEASAKTKLGGVPKKKTARLSHAALQHLRKPIKHKTKIVLPKWWRRWRHHTQPLPPRNFGI